MYFQRERIPFLELRFYPPPQPPRVYLVDPEFFSQLRPDADWEPYYIGRKSQRIPQSKRVAALLAQLAMLAPPR